MATPKWVEELFDRFGGGSRPLQLPNHFKPRGSDRNKYAPNSGKRQQAAIAKARAEASGKDAA
jgi:hypothetical protein